ncbi:hypothetical protein [Campylobacter sp. FOBRC14]|jgi:putative lipoprotein|uniref:hypothetical protein n=1 Tax=Campylobacter sp. FOBRC14 TaxID=936554 RepID=UPI00027A34B0|nr:hypothetical protein [Campylobacter sp. FOBRC14]EJP75606.1 putative lipoprotein [Campylobacter sp. FOBRC14]
MKILVFLLLAMFFIGCAAKPEVITRIQYQDVYIPVRCQAKMPEKPKFDKKDLQSARALAVYYRQVEILLKRCIDE